MKPGGRGKSGRRCSVLLTSLMIIFAWTLVAPPPVEADAQDGDRRLWEALRSPEHFVIMRHALAPGTGDPSSFTLGDCSTQRNLSAEGRRQARAIGERLRRHGLAGARIYSSQWCRCLETAKLLDLGDVRELPALNSFFGHYEQKDERMRALRGWLAEQSLDRPLILVTHQVTITALTGIFPSSGEMVVLRREKEEHYTPVGTIGAD